jgi:hypothetical protein
MPQFSNGQPGVYSAIIHEVVGSLKADFDEFGVGEDVLRTLQQVRLPAPLLTSLGHMPRILSSVLMLTQTSRNGNRG